MSTTPDRCIPHSEAWPRETRLRDMKEIIRRAAEEGWIQLLNPEFLGPSFGLLKGEAEAEIIRVGISEGEGK